MNERTRRLLGAALGAYAWCAVALLVLRAATGDRLPPVTLFSQLMYLALLPAPVLLVPAWAGARWGSVLALAIGSAALVWCCSAWLPASREEPAREPAGTLVVLTWNLGYGLADVTEVERAVRSLDPDFVALQEAVEWQAQLLFDALGEEYSYHGHFGHDLLAKAYLSRIEPTVVEAVHPPGAPRYLRATIPFAGAPITITNVHASARLAYLGRLWRGYEQLMQLVEEVGSGPSGILAGDLNLTPTTETHGRIATAGLVDSFLEAGSGPGFTFPVFGRYRGLPVPPLARIDYVWHTRDLRCLRAEVGPHARSDHHGVLAVLERR